MTPANTKNQWLGVGLSYRRRYRQALLECSSAEGPEVLEIIPDHFFANPDDLKALAERYPIIFHELGISPPTAFAQEEGLASAYREARLHRILELFEYVTPHYFTEHLAITHAPDGTALGHLAPIWYTEAWLEQLTQRILSLKSLLGVPIALENIAAPFEVPHADMDEGTFLTRLVQETGCGLLLDITNLLYTSRNFGFEPKERLQKYPLDAVWLVHLAGGVEKEGQWIDTHSQAVEEASFALLDAISSKIQPAAVFIERDGNMPPFHSLREEVEYTRQRIKKSSIHTHFVQSTES